MRKIKKINLVRDASATQDCYTVEQESVAKIAGLIRRGGTYSLRKRVPSDIVGALGKKEVWIALGTSDPRKAATEARLAAVRLDLEWAKTRETIARGETVATRCSVSEAELRRAVASDFWRAEQRAGAPDDETRDALHQDLGGLETRDASADAALLAQAAALIVERKLPIALPEKTRIGKTAAPFVPSPELLRILELLRRADIEHLKRQLDRLDGQHGDAPHDPLFSGINSVSPPPAASQGVTLGEAIDRFGRDPTRAHLGDTADAKYLVTFRVMREIVGDDRQLSAITRADCAAVQEVIAGLPVNQAKKPAYAKCKTMRAVAALRAERGDPTMSTGTVTVYTHTMSAFFNWAIKKGVLTHNPATRLAPSKVGAAVSRRPFTVAELNSIVSGLFKWSDEGRLTGRYWVPLIAILSGMRLGEIVSLEAGDVATRDGVPCFVLRKTADKSLKTAGSERVVPVHPELVRLGLLQRVARIMEAGGRRLFSDLAGTTQDELSDLFQKRFSYWLKAGLGINERGVSFHSFRHGFRDALREAGVPIDATRALGGWARSGGVEERYGQGTRPATLAHWMGKVAFEGLVLPDKSNNLI